MTNDLIIKNGAIATASDVFSCDVGVRDGMIAATGQLRSGFAPAGRFT